MLQRHERLPVTPCGSGAIRPSRWSTARLRRAGRLLLLFAALVAMPVGARAQTSVVDALSPPAGLCPTNTPVTVPVTLTRPGGPPIKGASVTFQASANLALPAGPASVAEGPFMATGGSTVFQVVDNGAGSYTVDVAVLSPSCGTALLSGTLFDVTLAAAATSGTGTLTITDVQLRDCANAPMPSAIGGAASVPIDFVGPAVTVIAPNGGGGFPIGSTLPISWTASDASGVSSVDVYVSHAGPAGPWAPIALAIPNTGSTSWTVTGPVVASNAYVRVVASDACGTRGEDRSDAGFSIVDPVSVLSAVSPPSGLCPANTPVVVPVTLARGVGSPLIKGVSVTFQLSPQLVLPAGPASVVEAGFMATGGSTVFQWVDNGGGSYTADIAVLSPSCGTSALTGTLFTITVAAAVPSGTGTVTLTSVQVRDCVNAPILAAVGGFASIPIDFVGPAVTVLAPNGGESYFYGQSVPVTWTASDPLGVPSVDLALSRTGPGGPWVPIALAIPNSGSFTWIATGPGVLNNAFFRVVARDGCGSLGEDRGDNGFTILDPATPALIALFRVDDSAAGVRIQWRPGTETAFRSLVPERAPTPTAGWVAVAGEPRVEDGVRTLVDRDAPPGQESWYRLSGIRADGQPSTFGPVSVRRGGAATSLALAPITPNPTRTRAQLSFDVPRASALRLTLHDPLGREVAELAGGRFEPGRYSAVLDVHDLAAGIYFVRMRSGAETLQRTVVVVR